MLRYIKIGTFVHSITTRSLEHSFNVQLKIICLLLAMSWG